MGVTAGGSSELELTSVSTTGRVDSGCLTALTGVFWLTDLVAFFLLLGVTLALSFTLLAGWGEVILVSVSESLRFLDGRSLGDGEESCVAGGELIVWNGRRAVKKKR